MTPAESIRDVRRLAAWAERRQGLTAGERRALLAELARATEDVAAIEVMPDGCRTLCDAADEVLDGLGITEGR